jgi:hypothetical protein
MGIASDVFRSSTDEKIKRFREDYPDIVEPMATIIDQVAGLITRGTEERISSIENAAMGPRREAFIHALTQAHPDWQTIGQSDPNWSVWLSRPDRYGRKAIDTLKEAQARLDAQVVINLLTDFKMEMGQYPYAGGTPPGASQGNVGTLTRSYIKQFYHDKARGKYRGREKEADAIEAKIHAAMAAGMVVEK